MSEPLVSFVVPCYKLGHYLAECVESILSQTYTNLEVLIMDDCSPDNTPEVARSFNDPRVRYIRNEPNLGHLRNYNKGIEMSRGEYVWLISADDRLRLCSALARYVAVMEANRNVAYACSAAVEIRTGQETRIAAYSILAPVDRIMNGRRLLKTLVYANAIVAASGMVRRNCYKSHGAFPLDLPYAGDWYLWCLFALFHHVAYFAEPLVAYRIHHQSMTDSLIKENIQICAENDLAVLWRLEHIATTAGLRSTASLVRRAIYRQYAQQMALKRYRGGMCAMNADQFETSLVQYVGDRRKDRVKAGVYGSLGDVWYGEDNTQRALQSYLVALRHRPWWPSMWVKLLLLQMGTFGNIGRRALSGRHMRRSA